MKTFSRHLFRLIRIAALGLLLPLLSPCASFSQDDTFSAAVSEFKAGRLNDARKGFIELESRHPGDPVLLLNLGLIAQKEKRSGAALGLWRKGLAIHPNDDALANAIDWLKPKLAKSEMARDFDNWERLRNLLLLRVSPLAVVTLSAIFLFGAGWSLLRWLGLRKRALEEELAMPTTPLSGIVFLILFTFLFGTSIAIFVDRLDIRGTVLNAKVEVRSAPDASATSLFEVFEGMEVVVRDVRKVGEQTWRQITYPGGSTGWVLEQEVLTSTDPSARAFTGAQP